MPEWHFSFRWAQALLILLFLPTQYLRAQSTANGLLRPITYSVGDRGIAFVEGDFDNDGNTDFAVAINGGVSVLSGNGDGTFRRPLISHTAIDPTGLAQGDFNGDGNADLIVTNGTSATVLLGGGDGTFYAAANYPAHSSRVLVADFNGDGVLDFAVDDGTMVFLGNGDGTFQLGVPWRDPSTGSLGLVADFNGDGIPDFLARSFAGLTILLSNGDGSFVALPPFDPSYYVYVGFDGFNPIAGVNSVAVGDFNGDGILDLAVIFFIPKSPGQFNRYFVAVHLGRGDGTFTPAGANLMNYLSLGGIATVTISSGDFNGDGISDLAVSVNGKSIVYVGSAVHGFNSMEYASVYVPISPVIGDFNGDGLPDVASLDGTTVSVSLGTVLGTSGVAEICYNGLTTSEPSVHYCSDEVLLSSDEQLPSVGLLSWKPLFIGFGH
jgi:hypothetical protein